MERPGLDDPGYRRFAWARYWRVMRGMTLVALVAVPLALAVLWYAGGSLSLHMGIAAGLAVFFSLLIGAALMGLVFFSSGTGHDEAAHARHEEEQ